MYVCVHVRLCIPVLFFFLFLVSFSSLMSTSISISSLTPALNLIVLALPITAAFVWRRHRLPHGTGPSVLGLSGHETAAALCLLRLIHGSGGQEGRGNVTEETFSSTQPQVSLSRIACPGLEFALG